MASVAVIGSGFSGLSAAAYLASAGHEVTVFEKNATPGGRARQFRTDSGYVFDMGPSWYWMPDVFEKFFSDFGHSVSDFYNLDLLEPSFDMVFDDETVSIPSDFDHICELFESIEPGAGSQLIRFMQEAEYKYQHGVGRLVFKPGLSLLEFADRETISGMLRLQIFTSFSRHIRPTTSADPRIYCS